MSGASSLWCRYAPASVTQKCNGSSCVKFSLEIYFARLTKTLVLEKCTGVLLLTFLNYSWEKSERMLLTSSLIFLIPKSVLKKLEPCLFHSSHSVRTVMYFLCELCEVSLCNLCSKLFFLETHAKPGLQW